MGWLIWTYVSERMQLYSIQGSLCCADILNGSLLVWRILVVYISLLIIYHLFSFFVKNVKVNLMDHCWKKSTNYKHMYSYIMLSSWIYKVHYSGVLTLNMLNCFKDYKIGIHISYHIFLFCSTEEKQIYNGATLHVANPILSIPSLLMPWQLKEPGHQQAWYWPNQLEQFVSSIRRVITTWAHFLSIAEQALSQGNKNYISNIFSYWPRPYSAIPVDRKQALSWPSNIPGEFSYCWWPDSSCALRNNQQSSTVWHLCSWLHLQKNLEIDLFALPG